MLRNKKWILAFVVILLFCCVLTSCNASSDKNYAGGSNGPSESDPALDNDYGYGDTKLPENSDSSQEDTTDESVVQKIIRTVYMDAQTKEFDNAVTAIRTALQMSGGFEESFRTTNRSYGSTDYYARTASMTLRIPAEKLDTFLSEIGGMVHVTSQNANVQNVTNEYYDIEARLNVLESERVVYEGMLQNAKTTSEMLSIRDRLYDVIEEIEAYKTRLRVLDSQIAYSTVTMNLTEVVEYSKVTTTDASFGERVSNAFTTSWRKFANNAQDFTVWLVSALPTILVFAVIGGIVLTVVLTMNKKHARKAKSAAPQTSENKNENK